MAMGINESGQYRAALGLDHFFPFGNQQPLADGGDFAVAQPEIHRLSGVVFRIADQHGGDALDLVGSFPVPADVHAGPLQDADNHLHGGCFAVGAGDCDDAIRQLHPRNDIRADFQRQLTGLGRAFFDNAACQRRQLTNHDCKQFSHRFSPFLCSGIESFCAAATSDAICRTSASASGKRLSGRRNS